jgi:transcriptional regulator with XRE-family HTH domain
MEETPNQGREYWPTLILAIRRARQWSQSSFASEMDTNQETVSRWERGSVIPSRQKQQQIEHLAEGASISSLGGISSIVRLSPYPMLLCDGNDLVIAASESSGFQEGRSVVSQTPEFQRAYFEEFALELKSDDFWTNSGQSRTYRFNSPAHGEFRAVLVSIRIQGAIYCVVQAIPSSPEDWQKNGDRQE